MEQHFNKGSSQKKLRDYLGIFTCKILGPYGTSSIGYNFGHLHWRRMWPLVGNLATKFKIWSSGGATCIGSNVVHQVGSHALPHCLELPYWHYQLVLTWYLHQPESHQLSFTKVSYSRTSGPKDRTPGLGPINIARGTTDPEIDSVTWIKLGNNMTPLTFVANLPTRWRHLY